MLNGKKITIGVTGSIAAYKAAFLIRLLVKEGAEVKVVMTRSARDFITPLTLSVLSKNAVVSNFTSKDKSEWNNHVELAAWADLFLIAPASANTMAKMAHGVCDNLLLATYLSAKSPVWIAPAMDLDMYKHPSTAANLITLESYGNTIIPAEDGELASGLEGEGRMAEPETILGKLADHFNDSSKTDKKKSKGLKGRKVLVTAGPTCEAIDPVRFITNHSSGKMGFAIAEELAGRGAQVSLISGPTQLHTIHPNIKRTDIVSAGEMYEQCLLEAKKNDIIVMAAAVADFTPETVSAQKVKKNGQASVLKLKPTKDILADIGKEKKKGQLLVGFAMETENEIANAKKKIKKKNLDIIVLNSLTEKGAGFSSKGGSVVSSQDTNKITIIDKNNKVVNYGLKSKINVAGDIADTIDALLK